MSTQEFQAMQRAIAENITVLVCITDVPQGVTAFLVVGSDGQTIYRVTEHGADDYTCDCDAGKHGLPCKHIMAVKMDGYHVLHLHFI